MTAPRTKIILLHLLEDLHDIGDFTRDLTREQFLESHLVRNAVSMSLINIGELARQLPEDLTNRHPEVPWIGIVGLRNRAAHGYHQLDSEILWEIVSSDLTDLRRAIELELSAL